MISEIYLIIKGFTNRLKKDNISAFSAQAAFFLFMSIIPFFSVLLTFVKFLPITQDMLYSTLIEIMPTPFEPLIGGILDELFMKDSSAIMSFSIIIAIWSSAKAIMSIINGLNSVSHVEDNRNYLILRFISAIYTVILVIGIIVTMLMLVFGNQIYHMLKEDFPMAAGIISVFVKQKFILTLLLLTLFFIFIYRIGRIASKSVVLVIPGAIFSSLSWSALSYAFSIYINHFSNFSYTYGSLATIVLFMLWIYLCMYLLLIGAEINSYFNIYFKNSKLYMKFKKGV